MIYWLMNEEGGSILLGALIIVSLFAAAGGLHALFTLM